MSKIFECGTADEAASSAFGPESVVTGLGITASVGRGGVNRPPDVTLIQEALNLLPSPLGGPSIRLVVDGLSGPKTERAIYGFQVHHLGASRADARIDPGLRTVSTLESTVTSGSHADTARTKVRKSLPEALTWILAADRSLARALAFLEGGTSTRNEKSFLLVDRCFKLRTVNNIKAKESLAHIINVFGRMPLAIGTLIATGGFKAAVKCKPKTIATAIPGGFFSLRPADRAVWYCPKKIAAKDHFAVTDVMVHELAHYTGPVATSPSAIRHGGVKPPAYGPKALELNHRRSLISASNYAWLAWLARLPESEWMTNMG